MGMLAVVSPQVVTVPSFFSAAKEVLLLNRVRTSIKPSGATPPKVVGPQATTVPSAFKASEWAPPPEIASTLSSPGGKVRCRYCPHATTCEGKLTKTKIGALVTVPLEPVTTA